MLTTNSLILNEYLLNWIANIILILDDSIFPTQLKKSDSGFEVETTTYKVDKGIPSLDISTLLEYEEKAVADMSWANYYHIITGKELDGIQAETILYRINEIVKNIAYNFVKNNSIINFDVIRQKIISKSGESEEMPKISISEPVKRTIQKNSEVLHLLIIY